MFYMLNNKKMYHAYFSKHNSKHEKQVIPLMIPSGKVQHYITEKKLSALLTKITSKHDGEYCCVNYFFRLCDAF